MNYQRIYDSLISNAQSRKETSGYTEIHHIHPKSLGGTDGEDNLVTLTAKEHYVAHHLLYLIYKDTEYAQPMAFAWHCMSVMNKTGNRYSATKYSIARTAFMKYNTGIANHCSDKTIYTFVHRNGTQFVGARCEFYTKYNMAKCTAAQIVNGKTQLNWSLLENISEDFYWPIYELTNGIETIRGKRDTLLNEFNIPFKALKSMQDGRSRASRGFWLVSIDGVPFVAKPEREYGTDNSNPAYNPEKYIFEHKDHGTITCTMKELCDTYGLVRTQISAIVYGRQKSAKGWVCSKLEE